GVCTPLLEECRPTTPAGMREVRQAQEAFVAETLRGHRTGAWVLCTHDLQVGALDMLIAPYLKRLVLCIYGDRHNPLVGPVMRGIGYAGGSIASHCRRRSILCPSVAPLGWRGGGALVGTVDGERVKFARVDLPLRETTVEAVRKLPFSKGLNFL